MKIEHASRYCCWVFLFLALNTFLVRSSSALDTTRNWLFIGDSHSVRGFGDGLRETLFQNGITSDSRFYQYSISGSMAVHWMDSSFRQLAVNWARKLPGKLKEVTPGRVTEDVHSFPDLNREINPAYVIVELGTNDSYAFVRDLKKSNLGQERLLELSLAPFKALLNENPTAKCALVLPPQLKLKSVPEALHQKFTDGMKSVAENRGCLVVDSRLIRDKIPQAPQLEVKKWQDCLMNADDSPLHPDQHDGVHFFKTKGEYWGRCVALFILENWQDPPASPVSAAGQSL